MRLRSRARSRGFNLIEVMVALVVISVGLLGIAKMQALALASTGTAKMRSLAALEAASLASTVRADRAYWSAVTNVATTPFTVTFASGAISASTDAALQTVKACTSVGACTTAVQITAYDLQDWAKELQKQLPSGQATLNCGTGPVVPPATTAPVSCNIVITWTESRSGVNSQSSGSAAAALTAATNYTLYVEP